MWSWLVIDAIDVSGVIGVIDDCAWCTVQGGGIKVSFYFFDFKRF